MNLDWTNTRVRLGDLKPWAANPKYSTKAQAKRILESFKKFGQVQTVAISPDCEVYDGHQRLSALLTLHGADYELDARQSNRPLTDKERQELVITLHSGAVGSYDWNMLAGWEVQELKGWGMDSDTLRGWNLDALNLREMMNSEGEGVDYEKEWEGMPEFKQEDLTAVKSIHVHFKSLTDYAAFSELVGQKLTERTRSIWFPEAETINMKDTYES